MYVNVQQHFIISYCRMPARDCYRIETTIMELNLKSRQNVPACLSVCPSRRMCASTDVAQTPDPGIRSPDVCRCARHILYTKPVV